MLDTFVLGGAVTLVAVGVLLLEIVVIVGVAKANGRRTSGHLIANALSGLCLILALRAALLQSGPTAIACFLGLAFVAHIGDVVMRIRRQP